MDRPVRVLLVEDGILMRAAIIEGSRNFTFPCEMSSTDSLAEALRLCEQLDFDAILLDLSLSDADIEDSIGAIQTLIKNAPVIVMTSWNEGSVRAAAIEAGAFQFLPKQGVRLEMIEDAIKLSLKMDEKDLGAKLLRQVKSLQKEVQRGSGE